MLSISNNSEGKGGGGGSSNDHQYLHVATSDHQKTGGLIGQDHRLEGLAGVLQVVSAQAFNKRGLLHKRQACVGIDEAHSLGWRRAGEGIEGWVGVRVSGKGRRCRLKGAAVSRLQGRGCCGSGGGDIDIEEEVALGGGKDKLFGIGGKLARHGAPS